MTTETTTLTVLTPYVRMNPLPLPSAIQPDVILRVFEDLRRITGIDNIKVDEPKSPLQRLMLEAKNNRHLQENLARIGK